TQQVRSLLCENLCSESFPDCDWKFVDRRDPRYQRDTGPTIRWNIKLFSNTLIRNAPDALRNARQARYLGSSSGLLCAQESFGKSVCNECPRSDSGSQISFRVKLREGEPYGGP